ncbi:MAG: DNA mismatch repair protein MutS, partial [Paracoccaceae bacterium]
MAAKENSVTPMMAQYLEIKARYPDALLFYRMGDFYEMFFNDAVAASAVLDIALTKRGKHEGKDIAMCGVPHHAADGYLLTLIRKGFRVAVTEQLENPAEAKKRGYKAIVKRDVTRLVTPGTLTEDSLLDARAHNYLAAISDVRGQMAISWVDVSIGDFHVTPISRVTLGPTLARLAPREVLTTDSVAEALRETIEEAGASLTPLSAASFDSTAADGRLTDLFKIKSLDAFGNFERSEIAAMGAIVDYLDITQRGKLPLLRPPMKELSGGTVQIDTATRRNLELVRNLAGERQGSLLATIDRTVTGGGSRLLGTRLNSPST